MQRRSLKIKRKRFQNKPNLKQVLYQRMRKNQRKRNKIKEKKRLKKIWKLVVNQNNHQTWRSRWVLPKKWRQKKIKLKKTKLNCLKSRPRSKQRMIKSLMKRNKKKQKQRRKRTKREPRSRILWKPNKKLIICPSN